MPGAARGTATCGAWNGQPAPQRCGSLIGSIAETQEVLDFCAEHGIAPDIEIIAMGRINVAMRKVENGEVRYRYVIDMATLKEAE